MSRNRFDNAIGIQQGACNPSGIAHSILEACAEIRALPNVGTSAITSDSAIRLMVHQLAFICGVDELNNSLTAYSDAIKKCEESK